MNRAVHCLLFAGILGSVPHAAFAQGAPGSNQPTPMPPSGQAPGQAPMQGQPSMQHPPQSPQEQQQIQYKGKVSDVWDAKVKKDEGEDKVVLIETDLGQVILADLGPGKQVKVEEGMPATVTGTMMYMEGENLRRFVPLDIELGKEPTTAATPQPMANKQVKAPQKQMVTGKIVAKEKMNAKQTKVDQEMMVVEVDPETRILVDLGPASALKHVKLEKGEQVQVEGQQTSINQRPVLMAEKVNVKGKEVPIQRTAFPEQQKKVPSVVPGQMPSQPPRQPMP